MARQHLTKGGVTVILGGQAGSEGKGKFAGYLALHDDFEAAVCNFMPNAGHTWVSDEGEKVMVQTLPQAVVNENMALFISAGSAIELDLLFSELDKYGGKDRLFIHPRAVIVEKYHQQAEKSHLNRISSTLKGCGHALADKVIRHPDVRLARDVPELAPWVVKEDSGHTFSEMLWLELDEGNNILLEAPQGFDLDVNHGLEYPYCTSRQTTSAQAIADAGINPFQVEDVIAVIRPYPIRVGDAFNEDGDKIGTSGTYLDSEEISWATIAARSGMPLEEISEYTTVTKKLRRVFEPNWRRLKQMVETNGVTQIALNFANYLDYSVQGARSPEQLTEKVWEFIYKIEQETGCRVTLVGTGAKDSDIVDLR